MRKNMVILYAGKGCARSKKGPVFCRWRRSNALCDRLLFALWQSRRKKEEEGFCVPFLPIPQHTQGKAVVGVVGQLFPLTLFLSGGNIRMCGGGSVWRGGGGRANTKGERISSGSNAWVFLFFFRVHAPIARTVCSRTNFEIPPRA